MALDGNFIGQFAQFTRQKIDQLFAVLVRLGISEIKESSFGRLQQFDTQPFRRDFDLNLVFELVEDRGPSTDRARMLPFR
jgi:hypothetical protein